METKTTKRTTTKGRTKQAIAARITQLFTELQALTTYTLSAIDNRTQEPWRIEFKAISDETAKSIARGYRAGRPDLGQWRLQRPH